MFRSIRTAALLRVGLLAVLVMPMRAAVANGSGLPALAPDRDVARRIFDATNFHGGLIVHVGCGDGTWTGTLLADAGYVVHGLDTDLDNVRRAREHLQELGSYGPVSVDHYDGQRLPYADNLVNLLVVSRGVSVDRDEALRVLCPGGALVALGAPGAALEPLRKPRPPNTDEWTHYLHDASGNAVAHDEVVGPPRHVQWIAGPRHTRSHEHTPSISVLVSARERIFYIVDEAPIASIRQLPQWQLVARDAYNGLLLWKRPIVTWFPHLVNWGQTPPQLQRKLVAVGDRVYVTLGLHAPLTAIDAATGETCQVYEDTLGTEEVIYHRGTLLLVVGRVTDERVAELERFTQLAQQRDSPLRKRDSAEPLVRRFRAAEAGVGRSLVAIDADSGRVLWQKAGANTAGLRALSLCADGGHVFYQAGRNVVCVDLKTGRDAWSAASATLRLAYRGNVICTDGTTVTALDGETGQTRWTQPGPLCQVRDAFVAGGSLWIGGFKPFQGRSSGKRGPAWGAYFVTQHDLASGEIRMRIEPDNPGHHHRCYMNKATDRFILAGRRGTEFIDLESGDVLWNSWARGVCKYGVMPCNGLLYTPPHACACYASAKLTDFHALAATRSEGKVGMRKSEVGSEEEVGSGKSEVGIEGGVGLENTGTARPAPPHSDLRIPHSSSLPHSADWSTYRGDASRSGGTPVAVPAELLRRWQVDVGGRLSSPTVSGGQVCMASVDEHRVSAVSADSGELLWDFTAGGRVDSPPTLHEGRAIFGSADGCVYSVQMSDGQLAWRLPAARDARRIVVRGQLECISPVHGSVLVQDGTVYCTAGRSSYVDGGIDLCRAAPQTGRLLSRTPIYSPDPKTGAQPPQYGPNGMPGARSDILTGDDRHVYLRDMVFDTEGRRMPEGAPHLFTLTDFLDPTWTHRSYWIFGTHCSISTGCSGRDKNLIYGRLLVFDRSTIYGYGRSDVHWSNQLEDGPYRLFALNRDDRAARWARSVPIQVRALVLAGEVLFAAGPRTDAGTTAEASGSSHTALLLAVSASDGSELARYPLDALPVLDGMAAAAGRLYICLENGQLVCMQGTAPTES